MRLITIILLSLSCTLFGSELQFLKDGKNLRNIPLDKVKSHKLKSLKSQNVKIYNVFRKDTKVYRGYDFFKLLDQTYGKEWRKSKRISFKALDGYTQVIATEKMLKAAKGKMGLIAYSEKYRINLSKIERKGKEVDPGPYYLVWSNFTKKDKASHGHPLKWPYQLHSIEIHY